MKPNIAKFPAPVLGDDSQDLYTSVYGEELGAKFLYVLRSSPEEIAVISRLAAYLADKKKAA